MTEKEFIKNYDPSKFERPSTAVDSAIFSVYDGELKVLLIERNEHPFLGQWSLVGGYVDIHQDESLDATALRKLEEKTGFCSPYLEQVVSIGGKDRDPRGWTISTIYYALIPYDDLRLNAGNGASDVKMFSVTEATKMKLAFDHNAVLELCLDRLRNKALYTTLPVHLMRGNFILSELQSVYETILGHTIQQKSFRRRMLGSKIIEETGEMRETSRRPAMTYRVKSDTAPHYFTRNLESVHL